MHEGPGGGLPDRAVLRRRRQMGPAAWIQSIVLHQHPVILPLHGHVGDGAFGGPFVHIAVAGAVQRQMAEKARRVAYGLRLALLDRLAQPLCGGQRGAAVHLYPFPPDGVGAQRLVKEQRVRPQAPQVEGLPLCGDRVGKPLRKRFQHLAAKFQMGIVIGHGMLWFLLTDPGGSGERRLIPALRRPPCDCST